MSRVPNEVGDNAFYLQALPKPNWEIWFYKKVAGKSRARFDGHYSDHSLRQSCTSATRLYGGGVPEQLSQETTGHRSSDAVRAYKCTSSTLKRKASEILQGSLSKKALIDVEKTDENGA